MTATTFPSQFSATANSLNHLCQVRGQAQIVTNGRSNDGLGVRIILVW